jgi:hypothetical protein
MRKMIRMLPAILLVVGMTPAAQVRTAAQPSDMTEKMLIANERTLHDAVAKADKASFLSLVLPEGVWTTKQGFVPMERLVNGLEQFELTKWDIVNPRVTWIGEDSAIVRYVWTGTGTLHNQPVASTTLASTVWSKRSGKWLVVHHQQTDLIRD